MVYPVIIFEHSTFIASDLFDDGGFILPAFDVDVIITVDVSASPALGRGGGGGAS